MAKTKSPTVVLASTPPRILSPAYRVMVMGDSICTIYIIHNLYFVA